MQDFKRTAIDGMLLTAALDDLGIYPRAIEGGPNAYKERSDYQNGWNAAIMAITDKHCQFTDYFDSLSDACKEAVTGLLMNDIAWLWERNGKFGIYLNLNDTFCYAADCEELPTEKEIIEAHEFYKEFGIWGVIAYAGHMRNEVPLSRGKLPQEYELARAKLSARQ